MRIDIRFASRTVLFVGCSWTLMFAFQNCGQPLTTEDVSKLSSSSSQDTSLGDEALNDNADGSGTAANGSGSDQIPNDGAGAGSGSGTGSGSGMGGPVDTGSPGDTMPTPKPTPTPGPVVDQNRLLPTEEMLSHPPTNGTTVNVNNATELASAIANAKPGTRLVLKAGTYAGNLTVAVNGTADKPIVIEGNGVAQLTGRVTLKGTYVWFHRLIWSRGADITSRNNYFTHNRFNIPDHIAFLDFREGAQFNKVGYNRFHSAPISANSLTKMIGIHMYRTQTENTIAKANLIYRNIFTSEPFTTAGGENRSVAIYIAAYNAHLLVKSANRVEQNLFLNLDYQWSVDMKSNGSIVRQNTVLGKGVGSKEARAVIQIDHGKENIVESNYFEDTMGIAVREGNFGPHKVIGNKLVNGSIEAFYGFDKLKNVSDMLTMLYPSIGNCFIKNDGLLRIGASCAVGCYQGTGNILDAEKNTVRAHQGGMSKMVLGSHQKNTIIENTTNETVLPAIKIDPKDPSFGPSW